MSRSRFSLISFQLDWTRLYLIHEHKATILINNFPFLQMIICFLFDFAYERWNDIIIMCFVVVVQRYERTLIHFLYIFTNHKQIKISFVTLSCLSSNFHPHLYKNNNNDNQHDSDNLKRSNILSSHLKLVYVVIHLLFLFLFLLLVVGFFIN